MNSPMDLHFVVTALTHHRRVGAIVPTSMHAARAICARIDNSRPIVAVEYGPGNGVFTKALLDRLHPESLVLAIEVHRDFAERLERRFGTTAPDRARLVIRHGDAANVNEYLADAGVKSADVIISGIPFSYLDDSVRRSIVARSHDALVPGGKFIVYQYTFKMCDYLAEQFDVTPTRLLLNLPPLCIIEATARE
jgi:phospholipid N-methyltransferase